MREILFRGKRIDNGEWVRGSYVRAHKYLGGATGHFIYNIYGERRVLVAPESVSEYTGLHDKNGESIFEGDIVKGCWETVFVIYFDENYLQFRAKEKNGTEHSIDFFGEQGKLEVIGNKWDNPELLKGGAP